ncbi:MAG: hypothetical protein JW881_18835 [Spirochaetales bacterium]|nr:hypothetical protein [Spirochaetales bacterium]
MTSQNNTSTNGSGNGLRFINDVRVRANYEKQRLTIIIPELGVAVSKPFNYLRKILEGPVESGAADEESQG